MGGGRLFRVYERTRCNNLKKIIYHGSNIEVREPKWNLSVRTLDFGKGFYTTENYGQAKEWAIKKAGRFGNIPIVSKFEIDLTELKVKKFEKVNRDWLDFICICRSDISVSYDRDFDVIIGAVADDYLYDVINLYENGSYDFDYAIKRLKVNILFSQVCICSEKGTSKLKFLGSEVIADVE